MHHNSYLSPMARIIVLVGSPSAQLISCYVSGGPEKSPVNRTVNREDAAMTTGAPQPVKTHQVVILGAGFAGLEPTYRLAGTPVSITLVDRRNHNLFQPLLYQVATASLATSEIAWPIRYLLRGRPEVTTLLATVTRVDAAARRVTLDGGD